MDEEEERAISALSSFGLNQYLVGAGLPTGANVYADSLGFSGLVANTTTGLHDPDSSDCSMTPVLAVHGIDLEDELEGDPLELGAEISDSEQVEEAHEANQTMPKKKTVKIKMVEKPKTAYERYPSFRPGRILDFSDLFKGFINRKSRVSKRPFHVYPVYPYRKEVPRGFLHNMISEVQRDLAVDKKEKATASISIDEELHGAVKEITTVSSQAANLSLRDRSFDLVLLSDWEEQIIFSPTTAPNTANFGAWTEPEHSSKLANPTNAALESGEWTKSIIWEPNSSFRDFTQLELHEIEEIQNDYSGNQEGNAKKRARTDQGPIRDSYNLSNDHLYELPKHLGARHRVRQTFGQLEVEHAYPALKLQLPFYKTRLSKQDARSFHRPPLQFPINVECRFSKVRTYKKKKDKSGRTLGKGGDVTEALRHSGDLSLRETSNFVLWEYSEEHPPILNNFGMGSILVNYYRKKNENDDHVPKIDYGAPFVLEPSDDSPFMRFGYVYPGQTVPTLYNNLTRAPLFRQKPYQTDFLVVRTSVKGETRYYLREIKSLFVVGQTFPVTEVPGPHSRKITTTVKNRLQIIAFKLLRKSPEERLKINRLMKYFPDQNELQMRQRLKEFMEYHRRGPHQGFWRLKPNVSIPSDQDMLKMLSPESVILAESMQVGQRHLQDSGYGQTSEVDEKDESNLSIEQQLAPWITSKNFLQAAQNKAMLKLHGEGDPTGRGEAFSFIRVSMKEIFVRAGEDYDQKMAEADNRPKHAHRYNVQEQQVIYKSEVERVWKTQYESLSRKDEPVLSETEEETKPSQIVVKRTRASGENASFVPTSLDVIPSSTFSRASSLDRESSLGPEGSASKILKIRRLVDGKWATELVRDVAVINAYVRRRQIIEEESTKADALAPTGDAERDKRAKKRLEEEIARMKKNQERRLMRKNAKIIKEGGTPLQLNRPLKPDTTRRCGTCGQIGHMKTNRKCPKWAEANMGVVPPTSTPSPLTATGSLPSANSNGLGLSTDSFLSGVANSTPRTSHAISPLATSPPIIPDNEVRPSQLANQMNAPKIKLTLKKG